MRNCFKFFLLWVLVFFYSVNSSCAQGIKTKTQVEAKEFMETIYNKITRYQSSFPTAARLYSEDTTAKNGGLYGWLKKGVFPKEFDENVFKLKIQEVSQPFAVEGMYYIVQVLEKKEDEIKIELIGISFQ